MSLSKELWHPTPEFIQNSNLAKYIKWLADHKSLTFEDYHQLWEWSINNHPDFWSSIWQYFEIIDHGEFKEITNNEPMPGTQWFQGARINYAEHIFRAANPNRPAIRHCSEIRDLSDISWDELKDKVAQFSTYLRSIGVKKGDRVVAYLPNIYEASIALLSCMSIGAVWSSCSPDFGTDSVVERFDQIKPKVLIGVNGYTYNGKNYHKLDTLQEIESRLDGIERLILVSYISLDEKVPEHWERWEHCFKNDQAELRFTPLDFAHPIWVLYSSGTTGTPKAITHSHGGVLLEHYKYLAFHNDVHPGEVFFWYSTTGWMMWNFVHASLLMGATIFLYEGSPAYPDLSVLWQLAVDGQINHFGTSAPFLVACMKAGLDLKEDFNLKNIRSIGSTGSPLPPEAFDYVYEKIGDHIWLCSMSGGSDVCTAFVGGCPMLPVYEGEIQCRALGCSMFAYDESGRPVIDEVGEMVITKAMPSMPVYFWNDTSGKRYRSSYFEHFPGIWRHGDWLKITERKTLIILGRSDATLNRQGVRIGTSEIYRALHTVEEIKDSLIVNLELGGAEDYMPLFVVMNENFQLTEKLIKKIKTTLRSTYSPRHVPDEIIEIPDIPYTISGKKMETPVKKILLGEELENAVSKDSMRNPESLDFFIEYAKKMSTTRGL